jgi:hypothetical protein
MLVFVLLASTTVPAKAAIGTSALNIIMGFEGSQGPAGTNPPRFDSMRMSFASGFEQEQYATPVAGDFSIDVRGATQPQSIIRENGDEMALLVPAKIRLSSHGNDPAPMTPVPDPAPLALMAAGLALFGGGILLKKH